MLRDSNINGHVLHAKHHPPARVPQQPWPHHCQETLHFYTSQCGSAELWWSGIRRIPNMYSFTKSVKSTYTCCCSEGDALLRTGQLGWKLGLSVKIKERFHPKLKMSLSFNLMLFISGKSPLTVILVKQKKVSCTGFKWLEGEKISYFWVLSFFYCCMFMVCSFILYYFVLFLFSKMLFKFIFNLLFN